MNVDLTAVEQEALAATIDRSKLDAKAWAVMLTVQLGFSHDEYIDPDQVLCRMASNCLAALKCFLEEGGEIQLVENGKNPGKVISVRCDGDAQ